MKKVVFIQLLLCCSLYAMATGQSGDVITIDGEQWNLLGKPIDRDSALYHGLKAVLPKDRSINTANWDGYTAYWSIRNDRLYLDRIEVEMYDKDKEYVENLPGADLRKVFSKYYQQQQIVASWVNHDIRVAKGKTLYYVHSDYFRNLEYEQILTIKQGKVTLRKEYHNRVVVKEGFSLDNINQEEIRRRFPLHIQDYPELAGVGRLIISISKIQLDEKGNLLDCNVKVTHRDMKGSIEGLAQEMKTLLKQIRPWKTLYINGEYVSTIYHEGITFAYDLDSPSAFTVTRDTLTIDKELQNVKQYEFEQPMMIDWLTRYHDRWFFLSYRSDHRLHLFALDDRGNLVKDLLVPKLPYAYHDVRCMFVRNDSLILKRNSDFIGDYFELRQYEDSISFGKKPIRTPADIHDYYLDTISWSIRDRVLADDLYYEDDRFQVNTYDIGEWGMFNMFKDKQTGLRHVFNCNIVGNDSTLDGINKQYEEVARRVLKLGNRYYLFGKRGISMIEHPEQGKTYGGERYTQMCWSGYTKPHLLSELDESQILNAFVWNEQIYLITKSDEGIYLNSYKDNNIVPVMQLCAGDYRTRERPTQTGNKEQHQAVVTIYNATTREPIYIDVQGNDIRITYIKNYRIKS
jgi:hypothetical protein